MRIQLYLFLFFIFESCESYIVFSYWRLLIYHESLPKNYTFVLRFFQCSLFRLVYIDCRFPKWLCLNFCSYIIRTWCLLTAYHSLHKYATWLYEVRFMVVYEEVHQPSTSIARIIRLIKASSVLNDESSFCSAFGFSMNTMQ